MFHRMARATFTLREVRRTMPDPEASLRYAEELLQMRRLDEAYACFDHAQSQGAPADRCAAGRWTVSMLQGNFASAWTESDAIRLQGAPDPHRMWNGEDYRGKTVIVRCLHGFGDAIQFARYLPLVRQNAARLLLEAPPRMAELATTFAGVDEVLTWGEGAPAQSPHWDVQIEITELPYVFRSRLGDLPVATCYLRLPQAERERAAQAFDDDDHPRIGVVWSSGAWNAARSIPLSKLDCLWHRTDAHFWNLQGGAARSEWETLPAMQNLHDAPIFCADAGLLPLAAFICQLDLVLTVDTLAAHLAAALGIRTWLLLQNSADWRWMVGRSDSPWYPSMRIFRQPRPGDWRSVVADVECALDAWLRTKGCRVA